jgi:hypothetical protein
LRGGILVHARSGNLGTVVDDDGNVAGEPHRQVGAALDERVEPVRVAPT